MKKFISKHSKKVVLAVAIGGIVSSSIFGQGMPLVNEVHASSNVSAKKGVFTLDTVFVSNEYDPNISAKDRKPVAGVEYEVYSMETNALVARGRSDAKGRFLVKNLPEGHYKWTQTYVPARYNPMTKDKTANGPQEYGYLSIHPTDTEKVIGGHLDVKRSIIEEEQMIEDGLLPRPPANGNGGNGSGNKPPVTPPVTPPAKGEGAVTKPSVTPPAKDEGTVVTPPSTPPVKDDVTVNTPPVKDEGAEKDEVSPTEKPTENDKDSDAKDEVVTPPITNEDGDLVNKDGDLVNKDGHLVNKDGELVNKDGHLVDKDGNLVDKDGKIISKVDKDSTKDGDKNSSDRGADSKVEKGETRESNPDDVQTYDKGIAAFIALALSGVAGIVLLNRKRNNA